MTTESTSATAVQSASPTSIDRALAALWAEDAGKVTRACLFNLVVYGTDPALTAEAAQAAIELSEHQPCRSIVVTAEPQLPTAPVQASVSGSCKLAGIGKQVCCEQITIRACGESSRSLPALIASLLVPDVRVFIWPVGDALLGCTAPACSEILMRLIRTADRTLIDSAGFTDASRGFHGAFTIWGAPGGQARQVSDLHWMRCLPWREALAELFDPPAYREILSDITNVRIHYQRAATAAQPLLYASWLVSSLGWTAHESSHQPSGEISLTADDAGREIRIALVPMSAAEQAGSITKVELSGGSYSASVSLAPDSTGLTAFCGLGDACMLSHTHPLPQLSTANLVAGAVQLHSRQAAWRAALGAMQPWLGESA